MKRLRDLRIKTRLYGLVAIAVVGFASVLALMFWITEEYSINGPIYNRLLLRKSVMADYQPSSLCATEAEVKLCLTLIMTNPSEVQDAIADYRKLAAEYQSRQEFVRRELFDGPVSRILEKEVFPPADQFFRIATDEFLPPRQERQNRRQPTDADQASAALLQHRQAIDRAAEVGLERTAIEETEAGKKDPFGQLDSDPRRRWDRAVDRYFGSVPGTPDFAIRRRPDYASQRNGQWASDPTARVQIDSSDEMGQLAAGHQWHDREDSRRRHQSANRVCRCYRPHRRRRHAAARVHGGRVAATTEVAAAVRSARPERNSPAR